MFLKRKLNTFLSFPIRSTERISQCLVEMKLRKIVIQLKFKGRTKFTKRGNIIS